MRQYFVVYYVWDTFRGWSGPYNIIIDKHPLKWYKEKDKILKDNSWDDISISWWKELEEDYDK